MTTQHHSLEIYEPYDYHGANPLMVSGVMVLAGPMRDKYYLVELDQPLIIEQLQLSQLLVQPRYNGDKIDRAVSSTCTVNICRVISSTDLSQLDKLTFDDFERWGVGKICPPTGC